jgi:hypothetical protein
MKKHFQEPLRQPITAETRKAPSKAIVRYFGFKAFEGGRRLRFSVKTAAQDRVEVTFEVVSSAFINKSEVSLQDAVPMAYEKIGALLAAEGRLDPCQLCLTDEDIAEYIARHRSAQKEAALVNRGREGDIAA